jgi:fimbrial chaperone protein
MTNRVWRRLGALIGIALTATVARATPPAGPGGLTVAPVLLSLADARRSVSTIVTNPSEAPITVQVRLCSWTMKGEEEVYAPATDIGFSPPLFRLEPHATQAVRIVAKVPPGAIERSYRLIVDQLPLASAPGQLQLPVRMVLPVFIEPAAGASHLPQLQWSARYEAQSGLVTVAVANGGGVHARVVNLSADDGHGPVPVAPGLSGYALAGQTRSWSYRPKLAPDRLTITADIGTTTTRATVPVAR